MSSESTKAVVPAGAVQSTSANMDAAAAAPMQRSLSVAGVAFQVTTVSGRNELAELQAQYDEAESVVRKLRIRNEALTENAKKMRKQLAKTQETVASLKERVEFLEEELNRKDDSNKRLRAENEKLRQDVNALQSQIHALQVQIQQQLGEHREDIRKLTEKHATDIQALQEEVSVIRGDLAARNAAASIEQRILREIGTIGDDEPPYEYLDQLEADANLDPQVRDALMKTAFTASVLGSVGRVIRACKRDGNAVAHGPVTTEGFDAVMERLRHELPRRLANRNGIIDYIGKYRNELVKHN